MNAPAVKRLRAFILEREAVRLRRAGGAPWPWTADPVLQKYRFCNVRRNDDLQTRLIHDHWLHPHAGEPDLWFTMVIARLINWWPTLEAAGYPLKRGVWDPQGLRAACAERKAAGLKVFTGAYMVRADAVLSGAKADYLIDYVLTPLWADREALRPRKGDTLDDFHRRLMRYRDMGSFMAAQVVADVKYDPRGPLRRARDWASWAASGPGSRRGLARVLDMPINYPWRESAWREAFHPLWLNRTQQIGKLPGLDLTGQDLQNCLCEFDKYERVRLGEGTPRSLYSPPVTSPQEPTA